MSAIIFSFASFAFMPNKDFTGFGNLSTASPSYQVQDEPEVKHTFNLNHIRESLRMELFQLAAFGCFIK